MESKRRELMQLSGLAFLGLTGIAAAEEQTPGRNEKSEQGEMFVHVHFFKFKPDVPEEEIAALMQELAGLKEKIPVLKEFLVGKNTSPRGQGYQYAQVSVFEKEEDLQVYEKHPEHRKLVRRIGPKMAGGITQDFVPL